jgi:outer membrane protein TolC
VIIQGIPAELLLRRPDIRTAAWQIAAQSAQIGVAKADYYPAITLLGSIGWSADSLDTSSDTSSLVVGPALTWNVFDYGRIRNNVRLQDARLQQSIEIFQDSVLQAAREIDDAAISVVKTGEQQLVLADALIAAERSLELANTRYQEGYADFQRVLDAQRALFAQADQELINQSTHISAIIALYRSIGGGWIDMSVEQRRTVVPRQRLAQQVAPALLVLGNLIQLTIWAVVFMMLGSSRNWPRPCITRP